MPDDNAVRINPIRRDVGGTLNQFARVGHTPGSDRQLPLKFVDIPIDVSDCRRRDVLSDMGRDARQIGIRPGRKNDPHSELR